MTKEKIQLLLKDLCGRLPHGVKCVFHTKNGDVPSTIVKIDIENETISHKPDGHSLIYFHLVETDHIKPYLRPMSSMTEEEKKYIDENFFWGYVEVSGEKCYDKTPEYYDWLNAHHFDYRGLIEKGLALEAPEGMYKVK